MKEIMKKKRRFGDRYDGFRVREQDPLFHVIPHIMRSRLDSQVFFDEQIDITELKHFITKYKREIPNLCMYHLLVMAVIRTFVERPRLNRFVSGQKIYDRSYLRASLTVKKSMNEDAEESIVMPVFDPDDTLYEVAEKFNCAVEEIRQEEGGNGTDITVKLINMIPGFAKRFFVWAMRSLDSVGKMPKLINRVSPFHSSLFITNVGSIGLRPIYHHLYEFGTTSVFFAIGKKETIREINKDGSVNSKTVINIRVVLDERICDGYYFASAIKRFKHLLKRPETLLVPPGVTPERTKEEEFILQ